MRQARLDTAVRQFVAAEDLFSVYQTIVTQIADGLDCDFCFFVTVDDSTCISQAASHNERTYDAISAPFIHGVAREAATRETVSVINDLTVTRATNISQSSLGDQNSVYRSGRTSTAADGRGATVSVSGQPNTQPRSILTVPVDETAVVQAMDQTTGAFSEDDAEWVERLLSFAVPALSRLQPETPSHTDDELNEESTIEFNLPDESHTDAGPDQQSHSDTSGSASELTKDADQLLTVVNGLVHDLKNPLTIAQGRLKLVLEDEAEDDRPREELEQALAALDRIERLVKQFKTLQEGGIVTETQAIELDEIATDCWEMVPTNNATLQVDGSLTFTADPDACARLLENLFRNAVDHGGPDVTVRVGRLNGDGLFIEDDGVGIPKEDRPHVFEPGYSRDETGAGVGLATVHQIVDEHDWEISVAESDDGGARFEITDVELVQE